MSKQKGYWESNYVVAPMLASLRTTLVRIEEKLQSTAVELRVLRGLVLGLGLDVDRLLEGNKKPRQQPEAADGVPGVDGG